MNIYIYIYIYICILYRVYIYIYKCIYASSFFPPSFLWTPWRTHLDGNQGFLFSFQDIVVACPRSCNTATWLGKRIPSGTNSLDRNFRTKDPDVPQFQTIITLCTPSMKKGIRCDSSREIDAFKSPFRSDWIIVALQTLLWPCLISTLTSAHTRYYEQTMQPFIRKS